MRRQRRRALWCAHRLRMPRAAPFRCPRRNFRANLPRQSHSCTRAAGPEAASRPPARRYRQTRRCPRHSKAYNPASFPPQKAPARGPLQTQRPRPSPQGQCSYAPAPRARLQNDRSRAPSPQCPADIPTLQLKSQTSSAPYSPAAPQSAQASHGTQPAAPRPRRPPARRLPQPPRCRAARRCSVR